MVDAEGPAERMPRVKPSRRGRSLRILLSGLALATLATVGGLAWLAARFDANAYKPQIEAAVQRATGRELSLSGPIGLTPSLWPTIEARDVRLANAPGGSRPAMATIEHLEARVSLLALLQNRVEIERLVLVRPDILLETDADGHPNWILTPAPAPTRAGPAAPGERRAPATLAIGSALIRDGLLSYRDGRTGHSATIALEHAEALSAGANDPVHIALRASFAGHPFTLSGETGPLSRLADPAARTPFPVRLTLAGAGASLALDGTLTEPLAGRGYQATLAADSPDLAALNVFFTHAHLPPLRVARLAATIADQGSPIPAMRDVSLQIGASDLSTVLPGLSVSEALLTTNALDQPITLNATGALGSAPFSIGGTLGPAALLLARPAAQPYPVDLALAQGDSKARVEGTIGDPRRLAHADLALSLHVADAAAVFAGRALPRPLHDLDLRARLADGAGGFRRSLILRGLALSAPGATLSGDLTVVYGGRPSITGTLAAALIDADQLLRPAPAPPSPPPAPTPQAPPAPAAKAPAPATRRVFSASPLPFSLLDLADADLELTIGTLRAGGAEYRDIASHLSLADGKLTLDPFKAAMADGHLDARLVADGHAERPPVSITLRGSAVPLAPLLALMGEPDAARGAADLDLDLSASGPSAHALAASADGHLGLAMVDGAVDNRLIVALFGPALARARLPNLAASPGSTPIRCLAIRLDTRQGSANLATFLLDTPLFNIEGGGSLDLAQETMALRLRPLARLGGTGVVVPLRLAGPMRTPSVEVDASGRAGEGAGMTAQGAASIIIGALSAGRSVGGAGDDTCPAALSAARGGIAGPPPAPPATKPPKPADLLRQFLR